MPSDGPVAGLLLAAGLSSRMGSNKLLFEVEGESLLRRSARRALAGGLDLLLVVLGHQAERNRRELEGLPCRVVLHPGYEQGITTSVAAGVAALPAEVRAAMVLLADMPHVTPEMIAALIARYRTSAAPLVISDYGGVNAPPMLYDRSLFGELQTMTGGGCGKQVVKRHRQEAEILSWPESALADLDVPEDYEKLLAAQGSQEKGRSMATITLQVNQKSHTVDAEPRTLLVDLLREHLRLTGTHVGCDTSQCGACTVWVDGKSVKSCTMLAVEAHGREVTTIEGLATNGDLHPMQAAFHACHGLQCGFCTPGMVMSATELVRRNPQPGEREVRHWLEGNLCRCTGYHNIVRAVLAAADEMRGAQ